MLGPVGQLVSLSPETEGLSPSLPSSKEGDRNELWKESGH